MRRILLLVASFTSAWSLALSPATAEDQPNFLFIYTDDQRHDALGCVQKELLESGKTAQARFPWIESPNLDRLASQGLRFRKAFVVTALCAPSRAAFLTGCYGHINGVIDNHTPFPVESLTHASLMRQAGYKTAYIGKWHMGSQSGKRPGFDFSASFVGQGIYFDCPVEVDGVKTPTQGWVDDVSTEFALDFIRQNKDRPFSIVLGYKTCHGPFTPPPRTEDDYPDAMAGVVPNLSVPAVYKDERFAPSKQTPSPQGDSVPTNLGMFRGLKAIDQNVGKLLTELDRLGIAENTVVVYSSDNGFYLGEHGLGDKRSAYEESMRVPMLIRYPKQIPAGITSEAIVLNIDLAPTFLELAGIEIPATMQGKSWKPLWTNPNQTPAYWRNDFFYSYFREGRFQVPTVTALRSETMKLIKYPGEDAWSELFDLANDPYETRNLYNNPAYAKEQSDLQRRYDERSAQIGYHVPEYADEKRLKPEDMLPEDQSPKAANAWVLDYTFDRRIEKSIADRSTYKNDGKIRGEINVAEVDNRTAGDFQGDSYIEVPMSKELSPVRCPMSIEVTFRAAGDGVLLARGGQTLGYLIEVKDGKPVFIYRGPEGISRITGSDTILDQWVTLTAKVTQDRQMALDIDGRQVGQSRAKGLIPRNPSDGMQIGADTGSPVDEDSPPNFIGQLQRVRIYHGTP